ncbi:hypothetical protein [Winogradskyella eximia]|uniref:hypothetical protein n=1 Tax=Winogradskyella eximia TaxID=262006 RepID=UPI002492E0DB|nr:hypothetical protein [Winogradskyella eximia]
MKLTKEEIQFIDNYLIKNEVKFWDVRLELLDHIVSAVEDKMTNDGISFNEALLEIHHKFGNRIHNGYTYRLDFNKAIFIDNKGFKKFTLKKQKEIRRKHWNTYWRTFLPFVFSFRFLIEYIVLGFFTFIGYQYSIKSGLLVLISGVIISEFTKLFYGGLKKFKSKSLNIQMAVASSLLMTQIPFWIMTLFNSHYEDVESKPYYILFVIFTLLFIMSRHGLNNYINIYRTYKERFALLMP